MLGCLRDFVSTCIWAFNRPYSPPNWPCVGYLPHLGRSPMGLQVKCRGSLEMGSLDPPSPRRQPSSKELSGGSPTTVGSKKLEYRCRVGSKKLEYRCRMVSAGFPSFFRVSEDGHIPTFWPLLYLSLGSPCMSLK